MFICLEMSATSSADETPTTAVELGAVINRLLAESKIEMLRRQTGIENIIFM